MTLLSIITLILLSYFIWRCKAFHIHGLDKKVLLASFFLKCFVGVGLVWLYGNHLDIERSDADVFKYFDDAVALNESLSVSSSEYIELLAGSEDSHLSPYFESMNNWGHASGLYTLDDNRTIIRMHSVVLLVSKGDIWVHVMLFNLISFFGLVILFKGLDLFYEMPPFFFLLLCILPPSLLLWGSGMLKESLMLLPLGLCVFGLANLYKKGRGIGYLLIGIFLFLFIKTYVLLALVPMVVCLLLSKKRVASPFLSFGLSVVFSILLIPIVKLLVGIDVIEILANKQAQFLALANKTDAQSVIGIPRIVGLKSVLLHAPESILRVFFRPGLWEIRSVLDGMAAIENTIYILVFLGVFSFRAKKINWTLVFMSLIFILAIGVLIGSVTPILGAVVRYKVPALPFLLFLAVLAVDKKKVEKIFIR